MDLYVKLDLVYKVIWLDDGLKGDVNQTGVDSMARTAMPEDII